MSNFDAHELKKFDDLADDWWNPTGPLWTLHAINPIRLDFMRQQLGCFAGLNALDIGCGAGLLSEALALEKAHVTGIDLSLGPLEAARQHAKSQSLAIDYRCISAEEHAQNHAHHYDVISCLEMLEHVPEPSAILRAAAQMLKPGGWLFVSTLNRTTKSRVLAIGLVEYALKWLPKGTHQHEKFLRPSELVHMARQQSLKLVASTGLAFNPLTQSFQLKARDLDVNYLLAFQKLA